MKLFLTSNINYLTDIILIYIFLDNNQSLNVVLLRLRYNFYAAEYKVSDYFCKNHIYQSITEITFSPIDLILFILMSSKIRLV